MQKVLWAKGVFFPFLCLLFLNLLPAGCSSNLFIGKMEAAEDELSHGKSISVDLDNIPLMVPPSVAARHKIALAIDSIIEGDYNYKKLLKSLRGIRNDPYVPRYLKVEAGYLLVLVEKVELARQGLDGLSKKNEECKRRQEQMKNKVEQMKGELEEMRYKLEKIEEIHIDSEKRRGMQ